MVDQTQEAQLVRGLEGIYVTTTELSRVDGENGRLFYRGYSIEELAQHSSFEETAYLLWHGKLPTAGELEGFRRELAEQRSLPTQMYCVLYGLPRETPPVTAVRTLISALAAWESSADSTDREAELHHARRLTAAFATLTAALHRVRQREEPVPPRRDLSHAANFLYMFHGREPTPEAARAMDVFLVLYMDHGFNASTFTARVTASTMSDMYSAVTAALAALKGPLHGGAMEAAMRQFLEIGSPDNVDAWFARALAEKRRIMGIGHRVYKTWDPRAKILREHARVLAAQSDEPQWLEIAERLAERALNHPYFQERRLFPNVDYYGGLVAYYLGFPPEYYTLLFALSRVAGWTAHVLEQHADNRLIRPRALYTGPESLPYVPVGERAA